MPSGQALDLTGFDWGRHKRGTGGRRASAETAAAQTAAVVSDGQEADQDLAAKAFAATAALAEVLLLLATLVDFQQALCSARIQ